MLDRFLGWADPVRALKRHRARVTLQHVRAYEGASKADGWRPRRPGASGRADHALDARELRIRARALDQNVPYIARALNVLTSAVIGTGIEPKATGHGADKLNELFKGWKRHADADGALDVFGIQSLAYRAAQRDGEVLIRRRTRRPVDGMPVPMQLQVLEIDWLDSNKSGKGSSGGEIINGIEYDAIGRVVGYWLFASHPGDLVRAPLRLTSSRVAAADIIHLYDATKRPGQGRGISRLAQVIARARDQQLYEDAHLARKNLETRLGVIASADLEGLTNLDGLGELAANTGSLGELPSGGITQVSPGLGMTFIDPKPNGGFVETCNFNLHIIAAGIGVPFESMTGDMHRVNFSSARIRQIEFRRDCEQEQWLVVVPVMCDGIWRWFVDAAVLAGHVRKADYSVDHATPRWDYVNPHQDIRAEVEAIGAGVMTPSESLRKRGYDPAEVFAELGADFNAMRESGALNLMAFIRSPAGAAAQASRPDEE